MKLDFEKMNGLIPTIVQEYQTNKVLMLAYMDKKAWEASLKTRKASYYSRSRKKSWVKGESSGNFQYIKEIFVDCDNDTILLKVEQVGRASCHLGYESCFFRKLKDQELVINETRIFDPDEVYKK